MRHLTAAIIFAASLALSARSATLDKLTWSDSAAWNCVKTIAVRPFDVTGEFKGSKSRAEYMAYFVSRLAATLVRPGGVEKVTLLPTGEPVNADAVLTGEFLELSEGSRAARFWVSFGAGTAKCEVRIRAYRPDERTPIFDLEHGRVSPFSMSGDANLGDIDAVTADIGEELVRRHDACDQAKVQSVAALVATPVTQTSNPVSPGTKVSIESSVENAEVLVDGKFVGNAPLPEFRLQAGTHTIEVRAQGFLPWKRDLTVENGAATRVAAQLEKAPPQ